MMEQQTTEWFEVKKKKMSASHAQAIGNCGKGLDTYILEMMSDYYSTGEAKHYSNEDTDRGNELEPVSRNIYELETGYTVREVGFIEFDEYTGISPDGLIGDDGGFESKSLKDKNHFQCILNGLKSVDTKHVWQVQMSLLLTKRKWWDLVLYNPNFKDSMLIFRILPDEKMQDKIKEGLKKGKEMIKEIELKIEKQKEEASKAPAKETVTINL